MIALVITVIIIIILATIIFVVSGNTVDMANFAKFAHELSEVQDKVAEIRTTNSKDGPFEELKEKGFEKIYLDNVPMDFVSFNEDTMTGYWVNMDLVDAKHKLPLGKYELPQKMATFGKDDIYVYDKEGKVYYVRGWPNADGVIYYRVDSTGENGSMAGPKILSAEYVLAADSSLATVRVIANPMNGGSLNVFVGGIPADPIAANVYEADIKRNGTIMIVVTENGGGRSTQNIIVDGIVNLRDLTPPEITSLITTIDRGLSVIKGTAYDNESGILCFAFTSTPSEPLSWTNVSNVKEISKSYPVSTSGTYYFWVQNGQGLMSNSNIIVDVTETKPTYAIAYNANGGMGAPSGQIKNKGVSITLSNIVPTRPGYTFQGWSTSASGSVEYQPNGTYSADNDLSLYAVWKGVTYTISFDANGGISAPASQQKSQGETLTLTTSKPTRTGYTFLGWSTNQSATTAAYQPGGSYTAEGNQTLYAIWKQTTYLITYDANGGSGAPVDQIKKQGETLKLSSTKPTKTGCTFLGWSTNQSATTATYAAGANFTTDEETTLYAVWEGNTYTITYNINGGSGQPQQQTKNYGESINLSKVVPTKTGYDFLGWGRSAGATTADYQPEDTYSQESNITLYAVWKIQVYQITYNANGGTGAPASQNKTYNEPLTLSDVVPTREGADFLGWGLSATTSTVSYAASGIFRLNNDTELFAIWKINTYTITFDGNGAIASTVPRNQTKEYNQADFAITTSIPAKRRHTFKGWAKSEEDLSNGIASYQAGDAYTPNENITLYAIWESNLIPSIANAPVLGEGMVATYWGDDNATVELTSSVFASNMYSYTIGDGITDTKDSKWANAKTEDGSYWVWIPRFAYKLTYYTNNNRTVVSDAKTSYGDVDLVFMYDTSDTNYRDENGNAKPLPEGYIVHPAFQKMTAEEEERNPLGKWDSELQGIWIAKYEASREDSTDGGVTWLPTSAANGGGNNYTTNAGSTSTTKIRVVSKPSVTSWRNIYESYIYENCRYMYEDLNTHEMKNSEWGAVAYLTYSAYGRNGNELAVNQCSGFITGAGKGMGSSTVSNGTYAYTKTDILDADDNIAQYAFEDNYSWHTPLGKLASTTGNIYGIYDMSGGAWEYVASYITNEYTNLNSYGSKLVTSTITRNKQAYTSTLPTGTDAEKATADYAANSGIYGDAVYETSTNANGAASWCGDYSYFPSGAHPFFLRGGGSGAGVFYFDRGGGYANGSNGFRPVLCVASRT